jgi:hypothetical protein
MKTHDEVVKALMKRSGVKAEVERELIATKLAALIRMDDHCVFGPSASHCHCYEISAHGSVIF